MGFIKLLKQGEWVRPVRKKCRWGDPNNPEKHHIEGTAEEPAAQGWGKSGGVTRSVSRWKEGCLMRQGNG